MSSPDKPFIMHGGDNEQVALYNRISAIDRIVFLSGIDLRKKSAVYLQLLDLELWHRWYKNEEPNKKIDETFCQRAAEVIKSMETKELKIVPAEYEKAKVEHKIKLEEINVDGSQHAQGNSQDAGEAKQDPGGLRNSGSPGNNSVS